MQILGDIEIKGTTKTNIDNLDFQFPNSRGNLGDVISSNGDGTTSWAVPTGGYISQLQAIVTVTDLVPLATSTQLVLSLSEGQVLLSNEKLLLDSEDIGVDDFLGNIVQAAGQTGMDYPLNYNYVFTNETNENITMTVLIIFNITNIAGL